MGGSDYAPVRVGAFMGLRICSALAAQQAACSGGGGSGGSGAVEGSSSSSAVEAAPVIGELRQHLHLHPARFACRLLFSCARSGVQMPHRAIAGPPPLAGGGYLANVLPSQFAARFEQQLPEALSGAAFLEQYGPHLDAVTTVDPEQVGAAGAAWDALLVEPL